MTKPSLLEVCKIFGTKEITPNKTIQITGNGKIFTLMKNCTYLVEDLERYFNDTISLEQNQIRRL